MDTLVSMSESLSKEFKALKEYKFSDVSDLFSYAKEKLSDPKNDLKDEESLSFIDAVLSNGVHSHISKSNNYYVWNMAKFEDMADLSYFFGFDGLMRFSILSNRTSSDIALTDMLYRFSTLKDTLEKVIRSMDKESQTTYLDYINNYCPLAYEKYLRANERYKENDPGLTIGLPCNFDTKYNQKSAYHFLASQQCDEDMYSSRLESCFNKSILDGVRSSNSRHAFRRIQEWARGLPIKLMDDSSTISVPARVPPDTKVVKKDHHYYYPLACSICPSFYSALEFLVKHTSIAVIEDWFNNSYETILVYLVNKNQVTIEQIINFFGIHDINNEDENIVINYNEIRFYVEQRLSLYRGGYPIDSDIDDLND